MLRNRSQRLLQLSQEAYIEKIANQYKIDLTGRLPDTPIAESELLTTAYQLIRPISLLREAASTMLYQKKIGLVLYAATVSDSVNRGTSTSRGTRKPVQLVVYKRGSKARERKRDEGWRRSTLYTILWSRDGNCLKLCEIVYDCPL